MNTLIVYASKYGCAQNCAERLQYTLDGSIELCNLSQKEAPDLALYDRVIIGGSIYIGQIQKSVAEFCNKNLDALMQKKVGLFICCMFTGEKAQTQLQSAFPKALYDHAAIRSCFGGEITVSKLNFMDKLMTKMVAKAEKTDDVPAFDPKIGLSMVFTDEIDKFGQAMNDE